MTRLDIAQAASSLAAHGNNPSKEHMADIERCLVYMRDTKYLGLLFDGRIREANGVDLIFKCASDASYADDTLTKR